MAVNGGLKFSELIRKLKEIDNELWREQKL